MWDVAVEQRARIIGHAASHLIGVLLAPVLARTTGPRPVRTLVVAAIGLETGFVILLLNPGEMGGRVVRLGPSRFLWTLGNRVVSTPGRKSLRLSLALISNRYY